MTRFHRPTLKYVGMSLLASALLLVGCNQDSNAKSSDTPKPNVATLTKSSDPNHQADIAKALQDNIAKSGLDVQVVSVVPTQMPDMYWATLDKAPPVFVDKTGTYIIQGSIVALGDKPTDIGADMMASVSAQALAGVDKSEMIIFPAKGETKASIYVFSDPTCHYCQVLHKEIDKTNAKGIEVRYLAWPRSENMVGLTESVWCSSDRHQAITDAKQGKKVSAPACDNPVRKHMELGHSLGISGTPAVFAENGQQIGGYLPSDALAEQAIANKK